MWTNDTLMGTLVVPIGHLDTKMCMFKGLIPYCKW